MAETTKNLNQAKDKWFIIGTIFIYIVLTTFTMFHHEPWRDEAQTWLIARDMNIGEIFEFMSNEGTPALWHLLLVPLAKLGLPYQSMAVLYLLIAIAAVFIFIKFAPFSKLTKILFVFSYYLIYEYAIIARNYSISILLLFIIAVFYQKRFNHPLIYGFLIFLLFNTNVYSLFVAGALAILYLFELWQQRKLNLSTITSFLLMVAGGVVVFLQILPVTNTNPLQSHDLAFLYALMNAFLPGFWIFPVGLTFVVVVIILSFVFLALKRKLEPLFIFLISLAWLLWIFSYVRAGGLRHHGLILIILFFCLWLSTYYPARNSTKLNSPFLNYLFNTNTFKRALVVINICLFLSLGYGLRVQYAEYRQPYSGSKAMAEFITAGDFTDYIIVAHEAQHASALLPYLPNRKFWYPTYADYGTFLIWNEVYTEDLGMSNEEAIGRFNNHFTDAPHLLLLNNPLEPSQTSGYFLIYQTGQDIFGLGKEKYYLYQSI